MIQVVRTNLEQLVAGPFTQPFGEPGVVLRPRRLGQARVGDIADQDVLEAVRRLVLEGRARLADDEVAEQQVLDRIGRVLALGQVLDRTRPEASADDRRTLEHRLRRGLQPVDAGRDQRLNGVRDLLDGALLAALGDVEHDLLEEERVAAGLVEQGAARLGRDRSVLVQRVDQRLAVRIAEGLELDRRRAHAAAAPVGADVEQLRTREAEDHQRAVTHPLGHVLDQLEQRLLGPVDVLEDEDQRLRLGHQLRPFARGPGDLLLAALAVNRFEHASGEPEQVGDRLCGAALAELLDGDVERVVVGDVRGALDHLGQGPVGDALAVRETPAVEDGRSFERGEELVGQAALADARLAVDRDEVRAAVALGAREGVLEQIELVVPADERRDRHASLRGERRPRSRPRPRPGPRGRAP